MLPMQKVFNGISSGLSPPKRQLAIRRMAGEIRLHRSALIFIKDQEPFTALNESIYPAGPYGMRHVSVTSIIPSGTSPKAISAETDTTVIMLSSGMIP